MNQCKVHKETHLPALIDGLVAASVAARPELDVAVGGVCMDSRLLQEGDLFIAVCGAKHDARRYIDDAVGKGAAAVLAQGDDRDWKRLRLQKSLRLRKQVPVLPVDCLPAKISEVAGRFYGHPSRQLRLMGVTGTNGKTSCSLFIAACLEGFGINCGIIGTLGYGRGGYGSGGHGRGGHGRGGQFNETPLTTPDPVSTQQILAGMRDDGAAAAVMEVSSVGLHQRRVRALRFDTAVFTNLSRDHLDYHRSMEDYAANKKKLFTVDGLRRAVVNLDDAYGMSIINSVAAEVMVSTYSLEDRRADVYAEDLRLSPGGCRARLHTPIGSGKVETPLLGRFNFSNLLAVAGVLVGYFNGGDEGGEGESEGRGKTMDIDSLCEQLSTLRPVPGRMEIISGDNTDSKAAAPTAPITTVVDYAHTPDGLHAALAALRDHFAEGRICCVFGCGGNRDQGKRSMMGEIAECHADQVVVTDDNPRLEDGDEIVRHILSGMARPEAATVQRDRRQAIAAAVAAAAPGDAVLVAGKGHEAYQETHAGRLSFSDADALREALQQRRGKAVPSRSGTMPPLSEAREAS